MEMSLGWVTTRNDSIVTMRLRVHLFYVYKLLVCRNVAIATVISSVIASFDMEILTR